MFGKAIAKELLAKDIEIRLMVRDTSKAKLTGPKSIDMYEVADTFSKVLNKKIYYFDLTEEQLLKMLLKYDKNTTPQKLELEVLCNLRAWKKGDADLETDTFHRLLNKEPTSLENYIKENIENYSKGMLPSWVAWFLRKIST